MRFWAIIVIALLSASPAQAGPVVAAIGAVFSAINTFAASSWLAGFLVKTVASMALSALAKALRKEPRAPGIQTESTTSGGTTPQKFIVGRYATGGQLIAPPNSFGKVKKTPRAYLVYPIVLSTVGGCTLERVILDDEYVSWDSTLGEWGVTSLGTLEGYVRLDYEDGSQTAAHPAMLDAFGDDPDRPWLADMVGPGTCCAYMLFQYNREMFNGLPAVRFEMLGIPLYDPRKDSTIGGAGTHRWNDRSTWEQTENPMVIIYNIMRGIDVGAGMIWGGECDAEDLPLPDWFAAMNECDVAIDLGEGNTEPQYRCGLEIALSDEPAEVLEELMKTCSGSIVEVGGIWKPRVGPPALPSFFFTDDDIVVTREQQFDAFPSLSNTVNGLTATYPDPESLWEVRDAPPRYNAEWEAEDGGRRLVADLTLPACPYPTQVQRLMTSLIADHRRFRSHSFALPPEAAVLEPLETIGWTSDSFGYAAKTFEITAQNDGLMTLIQQLSLRERDQGDYSWAPDDLIVTDPVSPGTTPSPPQAPEFTFAPVVIVDSSSTDRRVGIEIVWDGEQAVDATAMLWEARLSNETYATLSGSYASVSAEMLRVVEGILPGADYLVRATFKVDRSVLWTAWEPVQTSNVLLSAVDIAPELIEQIDTATATADAAAAAAAQAALDAAGVRDDLDAAVVSLTVDYDATQEVAQQAIAARDQTITARDAAQFAQTNAEAAETAAEQSATAASGHATTASVSATEASQRATAAEGSAQSAATQAGNASTYASSAATSANTATTQANAAAASAGVAASTEAAINATVAATGPSSLGFPVEAWTWQSTYNNDPATKASIDTSTIKTGDADFGTCFEFGSTGNVTVGPMRVYEYAPDRVFAVTVRFKTVSDGTGVSNNHIGATLYQGGTIDATEQNQQVVIGNFTVADGVQTATAWFSARSDIAALALSETGLAFVNLGNPANPSNNGIMFHFRQNAGGIGTALQRVNTFEVRDITATVDAILARDAAETSATAAYSSEQLAAAHRDDAGDYAGVASTQRGLAETAAGAASVSAGQAATSATGAAGSASNAQSYANIAAQIGPRGASVVADTIFSTHGQAGGWVNWNSGPVTIANEVFPAGKTLQFNVTSASAYHGVQLIASGQWTGARNADAYVVEVDFTLVSGALTGAGVLIDWNSSGANNRTQVALSSMVRGTVVLGQVATAQAIFQRPSMAGDFTTHDLVLALNFPGVFGVGTVKNIKIHAIRVRVATAEELGLGRVGAQITAAVASEASARATEDAALAAQINTVSVSLGTVSATVTQQSTAIADLEGNAAAGYLLRAQAGGAVSLIDLIAADGSGETPTSVARIAASTILLDGSVGTDQLAVGLGRNLLTNTDFTDTTAGWVISYSDGTGGGATVLDLKAAGTWAGAFYPTLRLTQASGATDGYCDVEHHPTMPNGYTAPGVPVTAGQWYDVSLQASVHRCTFELRLRFYNAAGAHLAYSGVLAAATDIMSSSTDPEVWPRYWGKMQAPAGAAYATIHIRKLATTSGATPANSYVFMHKPQLAATGENATTPVTFSPGGTTLITGGKIITRSLTAEHLATNTITAASAVLANASVETLTIAGGAVTVPVSTFMPGIFTVGDYDSWIAAAILAINRAGFDTHIQFNCSLDCTNPAVLMLRVKRGSTVLSTHFHGIYGNQEQVSLAFVDPDGGTGRTLYSVEVCKASPSVTGGWNGNMRVFKRLLRVQQFKR